MGLIISHEIDLGSLGFSKLQDVIPYHIAQTRSPKPVNMIASH